MGTSEVLAIRPVKRGKSESPPLGRFRDRPPRICQIRGVSHLLKRRYSPSGVSDAVFGSDIQ